MSCNWPIPGPSKGRHFDLWKWGSWKGVKRTPLSTTTCDKSTKQIYLAMVELSLNISNKKMSRGFLSNCREHLSSWATTTTTTKGVETLTQDANLITRDGLDDLVGWSLHFLEWHYQMKMLNHVSNEQHATKTDTKWHVSAGTVWHPTRYNGCHFDIHCVQRMSKWHPLYPPVTRSIYRSTMLFWFFLPTASLVRTWTLSLGI